MWSPLSASHEKNTDTYRQIKKVANGSDNKHTHKQGLHKTFSRYVKINRSYFYLLAPNFFFKQKKPMLRFVMNIQEAELIVLNI